MNTYIIPPVKTFIFKKEKEPMTVRVMEIALNLGIISSLHFDILVKARNGENIDNYIKTNPKTIDELVNKKLLVKA